MRYLSLLIVVVSSLLFTERPAGAQTLDDIATTIDQDGRYLELELQPVANDAVDRANAKGIGFVYLDQENAADLAIIATGLLTRLDSSDSRYRTLIVLDASGVWVESLDRDVGSAADAALPQFATGAVAGGIDTVLDVLDGETTATAPNEATTQNEATTASGGGVPWLLIILFGVIAFFAVRFIAGRRRKAAALEAELTEDRAEIREQLRDNADHVIELGDRITTADDELRRMYEEAAQTFQDVSLGLDDASTVAEVDALDDRLDRAEWQFDVIEARLDGRTPPVEPRTGEGPIGRPMGRQPVPPLGGDTPPAPEAPTGRRAPTNRSGHDTPQRRSSSGGGMLGSVLGGLAKTGLLSIVMKALLGGALDLGTASRRTQQRRRPDSRSGSGGASGLGGGVLR